MAKIKSEALDLKILLHPMRLIGKRILFVDDEPSIRATLPVVLRRFGFTVTVAETVQEALQEVEKEGFDLLLSDLNIEKQGDGYEVVRAIRKVNPRCAAIVLTGYPGVESAVDGIHLSIDDYIIKPADTDALVAVLAEQIAAREPKARILSVSYDETLLRMRHMILEKEGYEVVSSVGLNPSLEHCKRGGFDLLVLGHSIPNGNKWKVVETFRQVCPAPIISLRRGASEQMVDGADFHIETDPEPLLKLVADVVRKKGAAQ
jgi:DNA-binding response OmpR family regulator